MRNIELKARLRDRGHALGVCTELGAAPKGDIHQVDTYFVVPRGRLKLREAEPGRTELVFYERPDLPGPKGCDYRLEPATPGLKTVLAESLGVLAVVEKTRTLFLWENVRIHLDRVAELGDFVEFEAVLDATRNDADGHRKLDRLTAAFGLEPADHVPASYLELTLGASQ